jgi:hypothetical protein
MAYKQKGWSPFTHDAKNENGTWKTDKHGQHHKAIHDAKKKKNTIKKRTSDKYKMFGDPQSVDPDAPGTPGQAGYEPSVKYDELDEKGKKLYKSLRRGDVKKKEYIPQSQRGDRDYTPQSQRGKKK